MTGHALIQNFIQKDEPLIPHVICHYASSVSLHMRSPFSFGFQSDLVFTCTLNRIRKGINNPLQLDLNFISSSIGSIKVSTLSFLSQIEPSIRLQTDYLVACNRSH